MRSRPEVECNCVAVRRGGKQQETNDQSIARYCEPDVVVCRGEPSSEWRSPAPFRGKPTALTRAYKATVDQHAMVRDRMVKKAVHVKKGSPVGAASARGKSEPSYER